LTTCSGNFLKIGKAAVTCPEIIQLRPRMPAASGVHSVYDFASPRGAVVDQLHSRSTPVQFRRDRQGVLIHRMQQPLDQVCLLQGSKRKLLIDMHRFAALEFATQPALLYSRRMDPGGSGLASGVLLSQTGMNSAAEPYVPQGRMSPTVSRLRTYRFHLAHGYRGMIPECKLPSSSKCRAKDRPGICKAAAADRRPTLGSTAQRLCPSSRASKQALWARCAICL